MSTPEETAVFSAVFLFLDRLVTDSGAEHAIVVAYSGGPDSTALLWALTRAAAVRRERGQETPRLIAAHLDHGLDPGSSRRSVEAVELAGRLGLDDAEIRTERLPGPATDVATALADDFADDGVEDWARRRRYAFLLEVAESESARTVVTAHHADDQAETVALRLLYGSGLRGLAGIRPRRRLGPDVVLARPLLSVRRRDVERALVAAREEIPDLVPLLDPTNLDASQPRSLVRHHLLPHLQRTEPGADEVLIRVAGAARRFGDRLDEWHDDWLDDWLDRRASRHEHAPASRFDFLMPPRETVPLDAFLSLPAELRRHALARLHARRGRPYPPPESAVGELERQLSVLPSRDENADSRGGLQVGVDCGGGLRWRVGRDRLLALEHHEYREHQRPNEPFTYTFDTPGATDVPEIFLSLRCGPCDRHPDAPSPWMFRGETLRAGLSLPAGSHPVATVRTRRPGDRLRPLGASGSRSLKDLLIDRKVPRRVRDRLPLLFLDGILAWVPGVTVDERFRIRDAESGVKRQVWKAEIRPWAADESKIGI